MPPGDIDLRTVGAAALVLPAAHGLLAGAATTPVGRRIEEATSSEAEAAGDKAAAAVSSHGGTVASAGRCSVHRYASGSRLNDSARGNRVAGARRFTGRCQGAGCRTGSTHDREVTASGRAYLTWPSHIRWLRPPVSPRHH